jgi:hypothetical protein
LSIVVPATAGIILEPPRAFVLLQEKCVGRINAALVPAALLDDACCPTVCNDGGDDSAFATDNDIVASNRPRPCFVHLAIYRERNCALQQISYQTTD